MKQQYPTYVPWNQGRGIDNKSLRALQRHNRKDEKKVRPPQNKVGRYEAPKVKKDQIVKERRYELHRLGIKRFEQDAILLHRIPRGGGDSQSWLSAPSESDNPNRRKKPVAERKPGWRPVPNWYVPDFWMEGEVWTPAGRVFKKANILLSKEQALEIRKNEKRCYNEWVDAEHSRWMSRCEQRRRNHLVRAARWAGVPAPDTRDYWSYMIGEEQLIQLDPKAEDRLIRDVQRRLEDAELLRHIDRAGFAMVTGFRLRDARSEKAIYMTLCMELPILPAVSDECWRSGRVPMVAAVALETSRRHRDIEIEKDALYRKVMWMMDAPSRRRMAAERAERAAAEAFRAKRGGAMAVSRAMNEEKPKKPVGPRGHSQALMESTFRRLSNKPRLNRQQEYLLKRVSDQLGYQKKGLERKSGRTEEAQKPEVKQEGAAVILPKPEAVCLITSAPRIREEL